MSKASGLQIVRAWSINKSNKRKSRYVRPFLAASVFAVPLVATVHSALATTLYWDINGTSGGATSDGGGIASGIWDASSTANWTTDSGGNSATQTWAATSVAVFSAGTNGTGASAITVSGSVGGVDGIIFEEGNVTISGGDLTLTGTPSLNVSATNATIGSILHGSGIAVTKGGTGTLTLTGANDYSGGFNLNAGTVRVNNVLGLGAANSAVNIANNTTLAASTSTARVLTYAFSLNGDMTLGQASGGTGAVTMAGSLNLNGAVRTLTLANSADTISATMTNGGITLGSAGTLTLSGPNTYALATTVNAGTLTVGAANTIPSGSSVVVNGGILSMGTFSDAVAGVSLQSGSITGSGGTLTSSSTFDLQSGSVSAILGGSVGANKTTAGTVILTGNNSYTGDTVVSLGTVSINGSVTTPFGTTGTLRFSGGTLVTTATRTASSAPVVNAIDVTADSSITTSSAAATVDLNFNNNSISGAGGTTLTLKNNAASGSGVFKPRFTGSGFIYNGNIALMNGSFGTTLLQSFNGTGTFQTFAGVISGSGGYTRNSSSGPAGTTVFNAINTYSGATTVNGGTLTVGVTGAVPTASPLAVTGGTLDMGASDVTVPTVSLTNGSITSSTGILTSGADFDVRNGSASAILAGGVGLNKTTVGTVTLSGANTYSGNTTISLGTLLVNNTSGSGTGGGSVAVNGGILGGTGTISGDVSVGAGGHIAPGTSPGTLSAGGNVTLSSGAILDYDLSNVTTLGSGVNDLLNLTSGASTLTLNPTTLNINAFTGGDLTNGTYHLIQYAGALVGDTTGWSVGTSNANGAPSYAFASGGGFVDLVVSGLITGPNEWKDVDGNWGTSSNWTNNLVPNAPSDTATFGLLALSPRTVTVEAPKTVGAITFNNALKYTIAGSSAVHIDTTSGNGAINVINGSHDITAPLALDKDTTVTVSNSGDTLKVTDLSDTARVLTKAGPGTLNVNHVRAGGLTINGGTLAIASTATGSTPSLEVGSDSATSVLNAISITGGKLDLTNNDLIVRVPDGPHTDTARALVEGYVASGFRVSAGADWNGTGIMSSTAASHVTQNFPTALGVLDHFQLPSITSFGGQTVGANDILVKYTWNGDATMDGVVNADDYNKFLDGFVSGMPARWFNGDFTYDGVVNADDYNFFLDGLLAYNASAGVTLSPAFEAQLADFATANGIPLVLDPTPAPEPTGLAVLGIAGAGILARRRRADITTR